MPYAYINRVEVSVPPHDVHSVFSAFAPSLLASERERHIVDRMAQRLGIDHRYSFLKPQESARSIDAQHFYRRGDAPSTSERMSFYKEHAFKLVRQAVDKLAIDRLLNPVTHVVVTSCTGLYAPGIDLQIVDHYKLAPDVERTVIGFMGCYAAFNGLKLAHHIVRSEPKATVLLINIELCTLHLQYTSKIEELLSFLIFADGCAASLISAHPAGLRLTNFFSTVVKGTEEQIKWAIGDDGFDMVLSGLVPGSLLSAIPDVKTSILNGKAPADFSYWAIHPGGRSILDAVQRGFELGDALMIFSRRILQNFGNMSSATVMFVLKDILEENGPDGLGCAMAFGPGLTLESLQFEKTAHVSG